MTYTLDGTDLGQIHRENHRVTSELDTEAYTFQASKDMIALDAGNVLRKITIEGTYVDTSKANLMSNFIVPLDLLQTGDQQPVIFHSDFWDLSTTGNYTDGNFNVKVENFDWDYEHGKECAIKYTLVLIESLAD